MTTEASIRIDCFPAFEKTVRDTRACWILWHYLFDLDRVETKGEVDEFNARHEAMKRVSGSFFMHARWSLLSSVLLGLGRLADPPRTCGRDNLTLERVFEQTDFGSYVNAKNDAHVAMVHALEILESQAFKDVRNKVLAHNDLDVAIGIRTPDVLIDEIRCAVTLVSAFYARIRAVRTGSPYHFGPDGGRWHDDSDLQPLLTDVRQLVRVLLDGSAVHA